MKTILHIAEAFGSGVLNYIKNLSAWQCRDYEVYVAYGIRPETPDNFKDQFDSRVHFIKVDGFTREISPFQDGRAFLAIKKIVRETDPALIHLHSTKAGVLGRWAIDCRHYTVLYSPHAYSFLMMNCSTFKRAVYRSIERLSDRDGCLTVADTGGEYEASKKVARHAICIPNGINPLELDGIIRAAKEKNQERRKPAAVCMMGKIVPQKNPSLFNEIAQEFPGVDFVWIGDGPLREQLTSPNIVVTGWLARAEAMAKVLESDIFLFPSAWESLSIALLEVMYIGKPCVVSNADGNRDVIQTGRNGFVCTAQEEYIRALRFLLDNKEEAERMGDRARRDVIENYNVSAMERRYMELYGELGLLKTEEQLVQKRRKVPGGYRPENIITVSCRTRTAGLCMEVAA